MKTLRNYLALPFVAIGMGFMLIAELISGDDGWYWYEAAHAARGARTMKTQVGDWVRFYKDGVLVIGIVEYRRQDTLLPRTWYAQTTVGEVDEDSVLERRGKS